MYNLKSQINEIRSIMHENTLKRYIISPVEHVTGPSWTDEEKMEATRYLQNIITDLLYYDAIILPVEIVSDFKDPFMEAIFGKSDYIDTLAKLVDSGLIISIEKLFDKTLIQKILDDLYLQLRDIIKRYESGQLSRKQISKRLNTTISFLNRALANVAFTFGLKATPKLYESWFTQTFKRGKNNVISIIYSQLPSVDFSQSKFNLNNIIDFLRDEETQLKRRRLFSWQNEIEDKIERDKLAIEHLPDLIATYLDDYLIWLKKSELKLKYEKREILYYFLSYSLTILKLPEAIKKYFEFKKRRLDLLDDEKVRGRELAYIIHARTHLSNS